jgi:methylmalonyl-CoA mutase cobalamin-binding subunit
MHRGVLFAAAATLIGATIVLRYLPARGVEVDNGPAVTSPEHIEDALAGITVNGVDSATPALVPEA